MCFDVMLVRTHALNQLPAMHIRDDVSSKTDFTVDLIWWASLRLAPVIAINACMQLHHNLFTRAIATFALPL